MIHVIATLQVRPGTRTAFLDEFSRLVPQVRAEEGCIEYGGAVDCATGLAGEAPARPDVVTVVEKWDDLSALELHLVAPHMAAWRTRVREYLVGVTLQVLAPAGQPD
ncbi:MAG: antibiotic biosynthesis monooxygenase [Gemmatimonadales bacterium]|nr:antibiotic biosynthesis monooxygenase [Gemmatimonadales bacterium]